MEQRKKIGFILGPCLFLVAYFSPILPHSPRANSLLAVFLFVVVWWVTECIPIPITALLIPIFITVFNIAPVKEAFAPFANPIIMLFLGSFMLARAMSVHALDQKLAFSILSLKSIGHKKTRILFALGLTTVFLSLWISNTATTAMMFPIALGVLGTFESEKGKKGSSTFQHHPASDISLLSFYRRYWHSNRESPEPYRHRHARKIGCLQDHFFPVDDHRLYSAYSYVFCSFLLHEVQAQTRKRFRGANQYSFV